jgi:hypothetical protein
MDIALLTPHFCFRVCSVSFDGRTQFERYFYADTTHLNTEHVLYHADTRFNRISAETLGNNPIGFVGDAVQILIEKHYEHTGLYDPFSTGYCKEPFDSKGSGATQVCDEFGIQLFEISAQNYAQISY